MAGELGDIQRRMGGLESTGERATEDRGIIMASLLRLETSLHEVASIAGQSAQEHTATRIKMAENHAEAGARLARHDSQINALEKESAARATLRAMGGVMLTVGAGAATIVIAVLNYFWPHQR